MVHGVIWSLVATVLKYKWPLRILMKMADALGSSGYFPKKTIMACQTWNFQTTWLVYTMVHYVLKANGKGESVQANLSSLSLFLGFVN